MADNLEQKARWQILIDEARAKKAEELHARGYKSLQDMADDLIVQRGISVPDDESAKHGQKSAMVAYLIKQKHKLSETRPVVLDGVQNYFPQQDTEKILEECEKEGYNFFKVEKTDKPEAKPEGI